MTLTADDFAACYQAVHGHEPFPWQVCAMRTVLDDKGGWPDVLAVPTGCGKTSALDIALFALAARPERFPRRIVMVIDRRVVVDQAYEHARRIATALTAPVDPAARRVADALRSLWNGKPGQEPVECALLRGGMPLDDAWARRPDRPVLALSTVDQVGSRLLFRGYGVSQRMVSVHAGLLGHDALFLLDEVHLAQPFAQTLLALRSRWRGFRAHDLPDRWGVVRLSATPGLATGGERIFSLPPGGDDDAHLALQPRLQASKPAAMREVSVQGKEDARRSQFASACAAAAMELLGSAGAGVPRSVAVVVNRVATAREAAAMLEGRAAGAFDVVLLTGRMRPLDRDAVMESLLPRIQAGRVRSRDARPVVVVATQCVEAGADFDFDALATECASLDALRQRFGRLDRLGERHQRGETSRAVILGRADQVARDADDDPVYGAALRGTWRWLAAAGPLDFGVRRLPEPDEDTLRELLPPQVHAPILLPAHLDAWSQTQPTPEPDPDIALWLHGPRRGEPEVQVVWRSDISEADLLQARQNGPAMSAAREEMVARLSACAPCGAEAMSLPLSAVRVWLQGQPASDLTDAVMHVPDEDDEGGGPMAGRLALHWAADASRPVGAPELRPGMTLVVPSGYGGLARGNWDPTDALPVADLAEVAQWRSRGRGILRVRAGTLPDALYVAPLPQERGALETAAELKQAVRDWLDELPVELPAPWAHIVGRLGRQPRIVRHGDGSLTLIGRRSGGAVVSTEDDGASFAEQEISLQAHSGHVWRWADGFARRLALPESVRKDVALAAWLHDVGKADPRFQKWLVGGSAVRLAMLDAPLAKSGQSRLDHRAAATARAMAGYPDGYRHELLSVAMVQKHPGLLAQAADAELVLHLIGSHHGWCRPFAPFADHEEDLDVTLEMGGGPGGMRADLRGGTRHRLARLDSGVVDRFWTLTERYGWWGLAWLEAIVRLADHRASEALTVEEVNE